MKALINAYEYAKAVVLATVTTIPVVYHWNKDLIKYEIKTYKATLKK